jgi:hypothetical protein
VSEHKREEMRLDEPIPSLPCTILQRIEQRFYENQYVASIWSVFFVPLYGAFGTSKHSQWSSYPMILSLWPAEALEALTEYLFLASAYAAVLCILLFSPLSASLHDPLHE